jgi:hypothetical protein
MRRSMMALFLPLLLVTGGTDASSAQIHGRVVKTACARTHAGYFSCRTHPYCTMVVVTHVRIDGSVSHRRVVTDRKGRFRITVPSKSYYVLAAMPPEPGMHTEPLELTVPPEGVSATIRVLTD